ncbi:uncharacterized protein LOC119520359 [Choloepus didactylus]|uniref:uncharacterized protein LOC119520359 n=1 Tax=Choloepus didactylus TaxID=27675 RepID=UPI00189C6588|nr:uncharacterized protein LOC119520359 [Choloepus didactylus]
MAARGGRGALRELLGGLSPTSPGGHRGLARQPAEGQGDTQTHPSGHLGPKRTQDGHLPCCQNLLEAHLWSPAPAGRPRPAAPAPTSCHLHPAANQNPSSWCHRAGARDSGVPSFPSERPSRGELESGTAAPGKSQLPSDWDVPSLPAPEVHLGPWLCLHPSSPTEKLLARSLEAEEQPSVSSPALRTANQPEAIPASTPLMNRSVVDFSARLEAPEGRRLGTGAATMGPRTINTGLGQKMCPCPGLGFLTRATGKYYLLCDPETSLPTARLSSAPLPEICLQPPPAHSHLSSWNPACGTF